MDNPEDAYTDEPEIVQEYEVLNDDDNIDGNNEEAEEVPERKVVAPKRSTRTLPKLNETLLNGPKGLTAIAGHFKDIKYKGKGYEDQDLNRLMKIYEYWCHRLFPKYPFDECLAKIEKLGHKRAVQTHIKKIRMNLLDEEITPNNEEIPPNVEEKSPNDEKFDILISETTDYNADNQEIVKLTEEQQERIRMNKERAEKLRLERLKKAQEKAFSTLANEDSQLLTQNAACTSQATSDNMVIDLDNEKSNAENEKYMNIESMLDITQNAASTSQATSDNMVIDLDNEQSNAENEEYMNMESMLDEMEVVINKNNSKELTKNAIEEEEISSTLSTENCGNSS